MGLVLLPSSELADEIPLPTVPVYVREPVILEPRLPLIGTKRRPAKTAEPALVGRSASLTARPSVRPTIRATTIPSEGSITCAGVSLVTSTSGIITPSAVVHTPVVLSQIRFSVTTLSGSSLLGLSNITSRTVTGCLVVLPLSTGLETMVPPPVPSPVPSPIVVRVGGSRFP